MESVASSALNIPLNIVSLGSCNIGWRGCGFGGDGGCQSFFFGIELTKSRGICYNKMISAPVTMDTTQHINTYLTE